MAITLHKNSKTIITTRNSNKIPPASPISYFINITIPQPKVKIKVPKLIIKALQRKKNGSSSKYPNHDDDDDHHHHHNKKKMKKKWRTPRNLKRVGSIFSNVFTNNKKKTSSSSSSSFSNGDSFGGSKNDDFGSVEKSGVDSSMSKSCSLKEMVKIEDGNDHEKLQAAAAAVADDDEKSSLKSTLSFSSFFNKRASFNFNNKGKMNKSSSICSYNMNGRQESSYNFVGVKSGIAITRVKVAKVGNFVRKNTNKRVEEEEEKEERGEDELCKKRILMGEKCKPLNASGTLHYDKNGVFLSEQIIQ